MDRTIALMAAFLISATVTGGEPMSPKPVPRDEQDLIFFQADRRLHIRLHLQVGGKSFQAHWDEIMVELFRFLDHDGDGVLSAKELEHAPSVVQLRQLIQGAGDIEADAAPKMSDLTDNPKSGVTLDQLRGYYHRVGAAPWQVDWVARSPGFSQLDDELCKRLNPAKPEQLSRE